MIREAIWLKQYLVHVYYTDECAWKCRSFSTVKANDNLARAIACKVVQVYVWRMGLEVLQFQYMYQAGLSDI